MLKGQLWIKYEWSKPFNIISITPVPKIKPILGIFNGLTQTNEIHVIYLDEHGDLETYICGIGLSDIKILPSDGITI